MEIYIGGYGQGKLELVLEQYPQARVVDETTFDYAALVQTSGDAEYIEFVNNIGPLYERELLIINHLHSICRKCLERGTTTQDLEAYLLGLEDRCSKLVLISNEIGNGIVPMDREERSWREETGRLLSRLAKRADRVERIVCQIAQRIK